jgi:hypothetical protein
MKLVRASMTLLLALASLVVAADPGKTIAVEVAFGRDYMDMLGAARTAQAKKLAEAASVEVLNEMIRYFSFVESAGQAQHRLVLTIDHPDSLGAVGTAVDIRDYYVSPVVDGLAKTDVNWIFREATSNLSGADSPESIAQSLREQLLHNRSFVIERLLGTISFSDQGRFESSTVPGWVIPRPRTELCIKPNSEIRVVTTIPGASIEEDFETEVKRNPSGDHESTFSRPKPDEDVALLLAAPDEARLVGAYVLKYERECPEGVPVVESTPTSTTF